MSRASVKNSDTTSRVGPWQPPGAPAVPAYRSAPPLASL